MTPFIIYGRRASKIGKFQVNDSICAHCMSDAPKDVVVFGKYAHIYWIPLFPMGKVAVSECTACKYTIDEEAFPPDLRQGFEANKKSVGSPYWQWIGLAMLFVFLIALW